jgi:hypothetical protein
MAALVARLDATMRAHRAAVAVMNAESTIFQIRTHDAAALTAEARRQVEVVQWRLKDAEAGGNAAAIELLLWPCSMLRCILFTCPVATSVSKRRYFPSLRATSAPRSILVGQGNSLNARWVRLNLMLAPIDRASCVWHSRARLRRSLPTQHAHCGRWLRQAPG